MDFHEKLQALRRQRGMTQEELAQKLFVSRTAISKWESGRHMGDTLRVTDFLPGKTP